jgi:hypothetical protein
VNRVETSLKWSRTLAVGSGPPSGSAVRRHSPVLAPTPMPAPHVSLKFDWRVYILGCVREVQRADHHHRRGSSCRTPVTESRASKHLVAFHM